MARFYVDPISLISRRHKLPQITQSARTFFPLRQSGRSPCLLNETHGPDDLTYNADSQWRAKDIWVCHKIPIERFTLACAECEEPKGGSVNQRAEGKQSGRWQWRGFDVLTKTLGKANFFV
jgi:hypothetical protein